MPNPFVLIGYKALSGTSKKTGNPFDIVILSYTKEIKQNGEGKEACNQVVNKNVFYESNLHVGDEFYILNDGSLITA